MFGYTLTLQWNLVLSRYRSLEPTPFGESSTRVVIEGDPAEVSTQGGGLMHCTWPTATEWSSGGGPAPWLVLGFAREGDPITRWGAPPGSPPPHAAVLRTTGDIARGRASRRVVGREVGESQGGEFAHLWADRPSGRRPRRTPRPRDEHGHRPAETRYTSSGA